MQESWHSLWQYAQGIQLSPPGGGKHLLREYQVPGLGGFLSVKIPPLQSSYDCPHYLTTLWKSVVILHDPLNFWPERELIVGVVGITNLYFQAFVGVTKLSWEAEKNISKKAGNVVGA